MALVVTIAGEDRTSMVETDTIRITQVADSFTFTAELALFDEDGDVSITAGSHLVGDEITIVDGATTYFGGYVVNQDIDAAEEDSRHLHLQCQGFGIRLNETLVEFEEYLNKADDWIIDDLFDTYLAAFDSVTHVAQIDAGMDISFTEMTLAECMEAICQRTKGRWYIDNDKKVHYFAAESSGPGWFLSDTPEAATENLYTNPSAGTNTTGWACLNGTRTRHASGDAKFGSYVFRCAPDGVGNMYFYDTVPKDNPGQGETYTVSFWVRAWAEASGKVLRVECRERGGAEATQATSADYTLVEGWQRVEVSHTILRADRTIADAQAQLIGAIVGDILYFDGCQFEEKAAATSVCIGGRAGCTWSGTAHASTSSRIISYSYHDKPEKKVDAAAIVNRVRVIGADDFAVNRNDATSQAAYGIRAGIVTDQSLETTAAMEERGDDVLDKNKDPRTTYTVSTFQDGAVAGQDIGFRCPQLDIDTEQVIRELNITWWMGDPSYELILGTHAETSAISRAFYTGNAIRSVIVSPNIPLASRGWSHDLVFSATDHNTVAWAAGTITMAGGVGSFAIDAGNTGNMAAVTYIYLDAAVSLTALQTDVSAANAVGANKILIAVAKNVAAGKSAIFQVFGGEGTGVLVDTESIAAGAVDTAEIAALAVEAAKIGAQAVETGKLALLAVETAQLGNEAVSAGKILANTITAGQIAANTITAAEILANTITAAEILANTITAGEIAANTITAAEILGNTITAVEIAAGTITTNEILANTILAGDIAANTITANEILANTITAAEIAAATITATEIVAATITADKLSIGQTLFSNADGLLILNPPINIQKPAAINYWQTLRGQQATMTGALHLAPGRWQGTKALLVEVAATNLETNPSMELGDPPTGYDDRLTPTRSRTSDYAKFGTYSQKVIADAAGDGVEDTITADASTDYTFSVWLRADTVTTLNLRCFDQDGNALTEGVQAKSVTKSWQRFEGTWTTQAGDTGIRCHIYATEACTFYVDGYQVEESDYGTTTIIGDMGDGYDFTGADHASTSTRAATEVNLDAHVGLINENAALSFYIVAQMPYDYDADWPQQYNYLFAAKGANNNHTLLLVYDATGNQFKAYYAGMWRLIANSITFSAGDWIELAVTFDFTNDSYKLYARGVLHNTDTTSQTAPTLTAWNVGSDTSAANQGGFAFGGYAVFDTILTAIDVAQIYNLQRPLVDAGAIDTPGVYILDGKFRIMSSTSGVRIEITADQIAGYDSAGTKQFYLQASDGKAYAGGGAVVLDEDGIDITVSGSQETTRAYKFNLAGANIGGLYGLATAAGGWLRLEAVERAAKTSYIDIQAMAPATYAAQTFIRAKSGATDVQLVIKADSNAGTPGYGSLIGASYMDFNSDVYATTFSTDNGTTKWKLKGVHGGTYVGWVGYVEVEINGTTYKLTHGTWT